MAKARRGSDRSRRPGRRPVSARESGGFLGQLGLVETGGTSPGLGAMGLAFLLALATYPIGWLIRKGRRRA